MKKNFDIHLKVSKEEKEALIQKANQTGLKLSGYCLFILLNTTIKKIEIDTI